MRYLVAMSLMIAACQAAPLPAVTPAVAASTLASAPTPIASAMAQPPSAQPSAEASCQPTTSKATVTLAGRTIPVDVAWTAETRARGLSGRPCLAKDTGLVLGWDAPTDARIWMPDMNFAIDVIFVRDQKVVMVYPDAQPCRDGAPCPTFGPGTPVDYVLEVPAGSAKAWGLEKGAGIALKR